jgi:ribosomal protein S18 acetylase RimI-like enzyme
VPVVEVVPTKRDRIAVRAIVETELLLDEPNTDFGFVTWLELRLVADLPGDTQQPIGTARAARIHVGEVVNAGATLYDVLDADSGELERLYAVFFDGDRFHDEFRQGAGSDLLYVSHVTVEPNWQGRNVELVLVRRLCDSLGEGCEVAAIRVDSDAEAAQWERMGFQHAASARGLFLFLPLAMRQARIVPSDDGASFRVVANPARGSESHH